MLGLQAERIEIKNTELHMNHHTHASGKTLSPVALASYKLEVPSINSLRSYTDVYLVLSPSPFLWLFLEALLILPQKTGNVETKNWQGRPFLAAGHNLRWELRAVLCLVSAGTLVLSLPE